MAQIVQMIVSMGKSAKSVTRPTMIAPTVAPTSGMRSKIPDRTASGRRTARQDRQDDEGEDAGDDRLRQRTGDVVADGLAHPVQRAVDAGRAVRVLQRPPPPVSSGRRSPP
jgi:hypothetical protein